MSVDLELIQTLRSALKRAADPSKAPGMQAYMKSQMPYWGVQAGPLKQTIKPIMDAHPLQSAAALDATALALWSEATHREERYAAIALTGHKHYKRMQSMGRLPMYQRMIVQGAWWDYVDIIASSRLFVLHKNHPAPMKKKLLSWARGKDLWKRRSAIICQLKRKDDIDLELLYAAIEPSLGSKEFFLNKAIGWALREHAKTDPAEVRRYIKANRDDLSPLSKREALKNIGAK